MDVSMQDFHEAMSSYQSWLNSTSDADDTTTTTTAIMENDAKNSSGGNQLMTIRFVMAVVISGPIVFVGIIANVIAFVVLCRQKQRLTTTVLLQGLAVADTLILIFAVFLQCLLQLHNKTKLLPSYAAIYPHIFIYGFPCVYLIRLVGTWLTTLLTIDRYIAVCQPLHAQRICTLARTYKNMAAAVLLAFVFCLPRFFEYRLADTPYGFGPTDLQKNQVYTIVYRMILFFVFMYLVPMTTLVTLNARLLYELRASNRFRVVLNAVNRDTRTTSHHHHQPQPSYKKSITVIVVTVVLVCIVCNVCALVVHLLWSLHVCFDHMKYLAATRRWFAHFSNLMVNINSAVNFVIYCLCSRNFRTELARVFHCPCGTYARQRGRMRSGKSASTNGRSYMSVSTHLQPGRIYSCQRMASCKGCSDRYSGRLYNNRNGTTQC